MIASRAGEPPATARHWPISEKRRIVELTMRAGASISKIARTHGVHPTSLSHWRSLYRSGKLEEKGSANRARACAVSTSLLPVTIADEPSVRAFEHERSVVHLTLASGAVLRFETVHLEPALICALLAELRR